MTGSMSDAKRMNDPKDTSILKEIELKLACDGSDLERLRALPRLQAATNHKDRLSSTYFDTEDQLLRRSGYVMRVRRTSEGHEQTVKAEGDGLFERPEWSQAVAGPEPDRAALDATPLGKLLDKGALTPLFTVEVEREAFQVRQADSLIEVALDQGRIKRPRARKSVAISEVELELKEGRAEDVFALAREIAATIPVRLGVRTKAERGYGLAEGETLAMRKAEKVPLDEAMSTAEAFRAIAHACLRHMRLNEEVLLDRRDAEAVHQMRVAIRRLRSAFSLFGDVVADETGERLRADLKRLSEPLGRARNLDVFLEKTLPAERALHPDASGLLNLEKHLEAQRTEAYTAVAAMLAAPEWRTLILDLVAWINAGPWLAQVEGTAVVHRDQPVGSFAVTVLEKRRRQVKKRGRRLDALSDEERHRVRIAAKKLRYGAEFFGGLYTGEKAIKRHGAFVKSLSNLQDHLGELNDIATGHEIIDEIVQSETGSTLFAAGLTAADIEAKTRKLLAAAAKTHDELIDLRPFWR